MFGSFADLSDRRLPSLLFASVLSLFGMADAVAQSPDLSAERAVSGKLEPRADLEVDEAKLADLKAHVAAGGDMLDVLYQVMRSYYPSGPYANGVGFSLTSGNSLYLNQSDTSWIVQTPPAQYWGAHAAQVPVNAGLPVAQDVEEMIASAEHAVDVVSLASFPDGPFMSAIQSGISTLVSNGRTVTVRILVGWYPTASGPAQLAYLQELVGPLMHLPQTTVKVLVGIQRTSIKSWNHSKIVAVDGQTMLVGGENLWDQAYLGDAPVHDLSVKVAGPTTVYAHAFVDALWKQVCNDWHPGWQPSYWASGTSKVVTLRQGSAQCVSQIGVPGGNPGTNPGIKVLGAGRFGPLTGTISRVNPADVAMSYALGSAGNSLRISQQTLKWGPMAWGPVINGIVRLVRARRDAYLVLSNENGQAAGGGSYPGYIESTADRIRYALAVEIAQEYRINDLTPPLSEVNKFINDLLCEHLHLAGLRFGPDDAWPSGLEFANHTKFFMVDDGVFYLGSENLYPSDLIEYGVFVSDPTAVAQMRAAYWDKLWQYSKRAAISGSEAPKCYFDGRVTVSPPLSGGMWKQLPGGASDIGMGPDGEAWVVGAGGEVFYWDKANYLWEPTPDNSRKLSRIAVGPGGMPWGILSDGQTIVRRSGNTFPGTGWDVMPGLASDIGVGPDDNVWVVGTGGVVFYWDNVNSIWEPTSDHTHTLSRIAVGPEGMPWGILSDGQTIVRRIGSAFPGTGWETLPGLASDIGVGPDGSAWVTGTGGLPYSWVEDASYWAPHQGASLTSIAVGPDTEVWGVNVYTTEIYQWIP